MDLMEKIITWFFGIVIIGMGLAGTLIAIGTAYELDRIAATWIR